jgi:hypothetical protein
MWGYSILQVLLLVLVSLSISVNAIVYETQPIIWAEDRTQNLKAGESELTQIIRFQNPCKSFYDPGVVNGTQEYFEKWCTDQIEKVIIRPLSTMCTPKYAAGVKSRKKRFFGFIGGLIGGIASSIFGVRSRDARQDEQIRYLNWRVNQLGTDVYLLQRRAAASEQRQDELEKRQAELREALNNLTDRVEKTEVDVETLKEWKAELIANLGSTTTLVAEFAAYFKRSESHLNEVAQEWGEKRLSLKLFEVFMMGKNQSVIDLYRSARPVACHIDILNKVATFQFKKNNTDFGVHILKADPFTMYKLIPGTNLGNRLEYVGPNQVAYDKANDCIVPYSGTPSEVILFPGDKNCSSFNDLSVYKYWRKTCEPMYYIDETAIQFKTLGDSYYIYCFGFDVKIYKSEFPCPNFVFKVHVNETVQILNGKVLAKRLTPLDYEPSTDYNSNRITYHLMPKIKQLKFDTFNLSSNCPISALQNEKHLRSDELLASGGRATTLIYVLLGLLTASLVASVIGVGMYLRGRTVVALVPENQYHGALPTRQQGGPLLAIQSDSRVGVDELIIDNLKESKF